MQDHELRPVQVDDATIAKITDLLRAVFPGSDHFTEEVLRWQYKDNPEGTARSVSTLGMARNWPAIM
ncbi:MAG: hypothetical protein IPI95_08260 [Flavobacteriales bacterium]|nr:hypothetical protein [Flavobacteriales bacterium]